MHQNINFLSIIGFLNRRGNMNTEKIQEIPIAVSVVVPVYNVERYIERCLKSLAQQDFNAGYEIIIVNDGTKDNSMAIAEKYARDYSYFRIITQENAGLSSARNTGLINARGDYIAFVDSDDFVAPDYISEMYSLAVKHNADIVQCRYCNYFEKSDRSINVLLSHRNGASDGNSAFEKLISDVSVRNYAWNKLYKRSLFTDNNISYPVGKCFEDVITTPRLFAKAKRVAFTRKVLYSYAHRPDSITGCAGRKMVDSYLEAYLILSEYLADNGVYYRCRPRIAVMTLKVMITLYGMIARQYIAGKGNGGSYIADCIEVRSAVRKQLRMLSPSYIKRSEKEQLSKSN